VALCLVPALGCGALLGAEFDDLARAPGATEASDGGEKTNDPSFAEEDGDPHNDVSNGGGGGGPTKQDGGVASVDAGLDASSPAGAPTVTNGSFEAGENGWVGWQRLAVGNVGCSVKQSRVTRIAVLQPRSQALGDEPCAIHQSVVVPNAPAGAKVLLKFFVRGLDPNRKTDIHARFGIQFLVNEPAPLPAAGFVEMVDDVTAYPGPQTLSFQAVTSVQVGENVELDNVSIVIE